jgi:hypothetical protein
MQHLINVAFYEATTISYDVSVVQIIDAIKTRKIVAIYKLISQNSILILKKSIHHLFSFSQEFVSNFFNDEMLFAIN